MRGFLRMLFVLRMFIMMLMVMSVIMVMMIVFAFKRRTRLGYVAFSSGWKDEQFEWSSQRRNPAIDRFPVFLAFCFVFKSDDIRARGVKLHRQSGAVDGNVEFTHPVFMCVQLPCVFRKKRSGEEDGRYSERPFHNVPFQRFWSLGSFISCDLPRFINAKMLGLISLSSSGYVCSDGSRGLMYLCAQAWFPFAEL